MEKGNDEKKRERKEETTNRRVQTWKEERESNPYEVRKNFRQTKKTKRDL